MLWISFAWTLEPLLEGVKNVTRRTWKPNYAAKFHEGDIVTAYDKMPHHGGKRVALLKLTCDPYLESTANIPIEDWVNEGFAFMEEQGLLVNKEIPATFWLRWAAEPKDLWVIRFRIIGF